MSRASRPAFRTASADSNAWATPSYGSSFIQFLMQWLKYKEECVMTKIILVVLVIAATLTECIVMRKSREYDAADNIAGLERCVKAMVVLGLVGIAAAVAFVAM
jgi:hypothetical protein